MRVGAYARLVNKASSSSLLWNRRWWVAMAIFQSTVHVTINSQHSCWYRVRMESITTGVDGRSQVDFSV